MGNIDDQAEGHEDFLEARPKFDNRHSCSCGFCIRGQSGRIGGQPDAASIVKRMKEALEPARPSVRVITLKVSSSGSFATQ